MKKYSLAALVAAGVLAGGMSTGASAADLGGNCCADLEERIAELEATTARKGNRKVSLTIGGWVSQQVMYWNDGSESNVYITDTGSVSIGTHVRFTGQAQIAPGWTAGYVLKLEAIQNDSLLVDQDNDNGIANNAMAAVANGGGGANSPVAIESSYWFVKSDTYGKLSVGKQSSAADNQAILPDGSGTLVVANYVMYDVNAFGIRGTNGNYSNGTNVVGSSIRWGGIASCAPLSGGGGVAGDCDGYPSNNIRYDSPVYAGFSASASWGEDDMWAVSLRYSGEFNGVKVALATAYNESSDENGPGGLANLPGFEAAAWQIGGYVEHVPTGLWIYAAYAREYIDDAISSALKADEGDQWYIKAGLRRRMNHLGHTIFYGEYGKKDDMYAIGLTDGAAVAPTLVTGSELTQYGLGVVQEIDAAAMSVWLSWRHYEADIELGGVNQSGIDDLDIVKAGALINF